MLTAKQHEWLLFIDHRLKDNGISPSFDEMREALDLKSKSGVHRLISALQERGFLPHPPNQAPGLEERAFIRRLPNRARALEVLKRPEVKSATIVQLRPAAPAAANDTLEI